MTLEGYVKRFLMVLGVSFFAAAMEATAAPTPATCVNCYSDTCWGSSNCGRQCSCVVVGRGPKGVCVGSGYLQPGAVVLR